MAAHAPRRLAIPDQRFGKRAGFVKFGGNVGETPPQSRLRGSPVQFSCLTTLAKSSRIRRLHAEAEILLRLPGVPLNLPFDSRLVALDIRNFEEALMEPRAIELLRPRFRQRF